MHGCRAAGCLGGWGAGRVTAKWRTVRRGEGPDRQRDQRSVDLAIEHTRDHRLAEFLDRQRQVGVVQQWQRCHAEHRHRQCRRHHRRQSDGHRQPLSARPAGCGGDQVRQRADRRQFRCRHGKRRCTGLHAVRPAQPQRHRRRRRGQQRGNSGGRLGGAVRPGRVEQRHRAGGRRCDTRHRQQSGPAGAGRQRAGDRLGSVGCGGRCGQFRGGERRQRRPAGGWWQCLCVGGKSRRVCARHRHHHPGRARAVAGRRRCHGHRRRLD